MLWKNEYTKTEVPSNLSKEQSSETQAEYKQRNKWKRPSAYEIRKINVSYTLAERGEGDTYNPRRASWIDLQFTLAEHEERSLRGQPSHAERDHETQHCISTKESIQM